MARPSRRRQGPPTSPRVGILRRRPTVLRSLHDQPARERGTASSGSARGDLSPKALREQVLAALRPVLRVRRARLAAHRPGHPGRHLAAGRRTDDAVGEAARARPAALPHPRAALDRPDGRRPHQRPPARGDRGRARALAAVGGGAARASASSTSRRWRCGTATAAGPGSTCGAAATPRRTAARTGSCSRTSRAPLTRGIREAQARTFVDETADLAMTGPAVVVLDADLQVRSQTDVGGARPCTG